MENVPPIPPPRKKKKSKNKTNCSTATTTWIESDKTQINNQIDDTEHAQQIIDENFEDEEEHFKDSNDNKLTEPLMSNVFSIKITDFCDINIAKEENMSIDFQKEELSQLNNLTETYKSKKKKLLCNCCPWTIPWVILVNSLIQIFIHTLEDDHLQRVLIYSPYQKLDLWRFFTYSFLHASQIHLWLNVLIQFMVGLPLETEQGHLKVFLVYFGGVLGGALGASIFQPNLLMVGASAGVYSLLLSHVPHILMNFSTISHRYFRILAVLVLCGSDALYCFHHFFTRNNSEPRIGVAAHISGAIAGLLLGFIFYSSSKSVVFRCFKYLSVILYLSWILVTVWFSYCGALF